MKKQNLVVNLLLIGIVLVLAGLVWNYNRSHMSDSKMFDNGILVKTDFQKGKIQSTRLVDFGYYNCNELSNLNAGYIGLEVNTEYTSKDTFKGDPVKPVFANPKYGMFTLKEDYKKEEEDGIVVLSMDYGNGMVLSDEFGKVIDTDENCFDKYSYDPKTKIITLHKAEYKKQCKRAPEEKKIEFIDITEEDNLNVLKLKINNKIVEFVSPKRELEETNINLKGVYESTYGCRGESYLTVNEKLDLDSNNTGTLYVSESNTLTRKIPIRYKTYLENDKQNVIIYSVGSGVYLELEIDQKLGLYDVGSLFFPKMQ